MNEPPNGSGPGEPGELVEVELDSLAPQATVHSPARRAQVSEEARTVVVSDDGDADATQRTHRLEPGRNDPTLVLRAVRSLPDLPAQRLPAAKPATSLAWVAWLVVGILALLAFVVGGWLALWLARRETAAAPDPSVSASPALPSARPLPAGSANGASEP